MSLFKKKKEKESLADEITKDLKVIANEVTTSDETPKDNPSKKVKSNPDELTVDIINKAVSITEKENKVWDEITQEERWEYIKQARN